MLHAAIAAGLILGLGTGLLAAATGNELLLSIAAGSAPLGTAFMNAIRMVVIPLVMAVIFTAVARLGDPRKLGRLGAMTLGYYWLTLIPAIVIGMAVMKAGLAILLGIDRVPDMFRSVVNLWNQISTSVLVDRWLRMGETR